MPWTAAKSQLKFSNISDELPQQRRHGLPTDEPNELHVTNEPNERLQPPVSSYVLVLV
jgi:hypothetical protein